MGQIVVCSIVSIDGYTEGRAGDVMAMPMDEAFARHNEDRARTASSFLFGATTYRGMVSYWPDQHHPDASPLNRYIAARYADGIPITVVSDTLTTDETGPWRDQTTIVRRGEAHDAVARLRDRDGDALIFGSRTLWTDLAAHGCRRAPPDDRPQDRGRGPPRLRGRPRDEPQADRRPHLGRFGQRRAELRDELRLRRVGGAPPGHRVPRCDSRGATR